MNLAAHELGMLSLFSNPALVRAFGLPAIVEGLAPTPEYLGVLQIFRSGLQRAGVSEAADFRLKADALRELLKGKNSPSAIFESQRKLGDVLRRVDDEGAVWPAVAPRRLDGAAGTAAQRAALRVDLRASRALHHLGQLVSIPNTNGVGWAPQRMDDAALVIASLMESAKFRNVHPLNGTAGGINGGGNAAIFGIRPADTPDADTSPATAPREKILFVAGYDVGFPSAHAVRTADPFSPYVFGDRLFGQGVCMKAGVLAVIAAMEVFGKSFPLSTTVGFYLDGDRQTGSAAATERLAQISDFEPDLIFVLGSHYAEGAGDFTLFENISLGSPPRQAITRKLMAALKAGFQTTAVAIEECEGATLLEAALGERFPSARIFSIPLSERGAASFEEQNIFIPHFVKWARFVAAFAALAGEN